MPLSSGVGKVYYKCPECNATGKSYTNEQETCKHCYGACYLEDTSSCDILVEKVELPNN
jgi:hypothetical protein